MRESGDLDPAVIVSQPVIRALDGLIVGGAASFALAVGAVLAAVLFPHGLLHQVALASPLVVMALVVIARGVHVVRHRVEIDERVWTRARAVEPSDAQLAQALTVLVPLAWLVGSGAILARHFSELHDAALLVGAWLPLAGALWVVATFAWQDYCRERIAAALAESDRRYRRYWQDVAGPR